MLYFARVSVGVRVLRALPSLTRDCLAGKPHLAASHVGL